MGAGSPTGSAAAFCRFTLVRTIIAATMLLIVKKKTTICICSDLSSELQEAQLARCGATINPCHCCHQNTNRRVDLPSPIIPPRMAMN